MKAKVEIIRRAWGNKLLSSSDQADFICETLTVLPPELLEWVTKKVWLVAKFDDAWAMTFRGEELKDQYLVIIDPELFNQEKRQTRYTILHEMGHVMLGHRNSIGKVQTQAEIDKQEAEADSFAKRYLLGNNW